MLFCKKTTLRRLGRALANPSKISMGRKPSASTQPVLKNTEEKTPKLKKQQCFRAEFEPDVQTSQAEGNVSALRVAETSDM